MPARSPVLSVVLLVLVAACSPKSSTPVNRITANVPAALPPSTPALATSSQPPSHSPSSRSQRLRYTAYECTVDCSGHEAGYEWAQDHDIDDPDDCDGKSASFIEGCRSYAEELLSETKMDEDEEVDDEEE
jgi:hypothetical protein